MSGQIPKAIGCIFCNMPRDGREAEDYVLGYSKHCFLVLNRYPYNNGHLMAVPYRHVDVLTDLSDEEIADLFLIVRNADAALLESYECEGVNIGINQGEAAGAGIEEHLHVHILPRWGADSNFMTAVGEARVIMEDLEHTYQRLKPYAARMGLAGTPPDDLPELGE